jgi:hypothetical protein
MTTWHLDVDRVRIVGAGAQGMDAAELRALVAQAMQSALESAPLPNGRTVRASVEVHVPTLSGRTAIAGAVARGVTQAVGGGRAHG